MKDICHRSKTKYKLFVFGNDNFKTPDSSVLFLPGIGPVSSTLCALSSVARLSVSMTMLMSSGAHRAARSFPAVVDGLPAGGPSPATGHRSARRCHPSLDDDLNGIGVCMGTGSGNSSSAGSRPTPPRTKFSTSGSRNAVSCAGQPVCLITVPVYKWEAEGYHLPE
jgi:hypothetical protein